MTKPQHLKPTPWCLLKAKTGCLQTFWERLDYERIKYQTVVRRAALCELDRVMLLSGLS